MIVFARIEILFHVPVSTASVRSFPRVGHGVGQPFLQVRRVKTPQIPFHKNAWYFPTPNFSLSGKYHTQKLRCCKQRLSLFISSRYSTQFSTSKSGTRSNSRTLFVTRVMPSDLACAAISISNGPIGVPPL